MNLRALRTIFPCLALACLWGSSAVTFAGTCENIAIPAYFYPSQPTSQWNSAVDNAPLPTGRQQILIMNPSSGPGNSYDPNYAAAINTVHNAGTGFLVIGYVHTKYGKRSLGTVESEVDKYYSWYPAIDGIFVDETASAASYVSSYYQPLANYITAKKTGANVMLNPGVYPDQSYLNISVPSTSMLIVNVFESAYSNYVNLSVPSWAFSYPAIKMSHLVYSAT
ncbi:MAG TPA: spherulation-specific family 4 protein, partial [Candidatus Sulfotelmatobacter sp.]|nr:spherulation-specific family 4 protein [Candidatus Sulfotelmatobacter sp.]